MYRATRKAKRDYENHIANTENRRLLYGYIKSKSQNRISVGPLLNKEGKEVTDSEKMAELLSEHYSSVFKTEVLPMEEVKQLYEGDSPLLDTQFSEAFVRLQLSRLREDLATGPDGIHARLLKRICIFIAEALADIFNSLLHHTKVPPVWMDSNITPTYKPGKVKTDPAGYRPIAVTCSLGRIFERKINNAIDFHLESNKLIHDSQHGFEKAGPARQTFWFLWSTTPRGQKKMKMKMSAILTCAPSLTVSPISGAWPPSMLMVYHRRARYTSG